MLCGFAQVSLFWDPLILMLMDELRAKLYSKHLTHARHIGMFTKFKEERVAAAAADDHSSHHGT